MSHKEIIATFIKILHCGRMSMTMKYLFDLLRDILLCTEYSLFYKIILGRYFGLNQVNYTTFPSFQKGDMSLSF
jgi:hypothetical protein